MKIICENMELARGVQTVLKAVPAKPTMHILENILIEAEDGICLTGNDLELGIRMEIIGDIVEKGTIAVNAKVLSDIVRKLPEGDVALETKGKDEVFISCKKVKYNLSTQPGNDYPRISEIEKTSRIWISEFDLKEAIRQTIFSAAANHSNKLLTGELFEINGKSMKVVSLDGFRIAIRNIRLAENYGTRKVIVPAKTLMEIAKIISSDPKSMVSLYFAKNHIMFEIGQVTAVSRLIEGEYFNIDKMVASDYQTKVQVPKKELQECIDRAGILQKKDEKKPIIINIKEDSMELKAATALGMLDEKIPAETQGKQLEVGFDPRFLLEMLRVIDDEQVEVYLNNAKSPCIVRDKDESYIYLILPMNLPKAA